MEYGEGYNRDPDDDETYEQSSAEITKLGNIFSSDGFCELLQKNADFHIKLFDMPAIEIDKDCLPSAITDKDQFKYKDRLWVSHLQIDVRLPDPIKKSDIELGWFASVRCNINGLPCQLQSRQNSCKPNYDEQEQACDPAAIAELMTAVLSVLNEESSVSNQIANSSSLELGDRLEAIAWLLDKHTKQSLIQQNSSPIILNDHEALILKTIITERKSKILTSVNTNHEHSYIVSASYVRALDGGLLVDRYDWVEHEGNTPGQLATLSRQKVLGGIEDLDRLHILDASNEIEVMDFEYDTPKWIDLAERIGQALECAVNKNSSSKLKQL